MEITSGEAPEPQTPAPFSGGASVNLKSIKPQEKPEDIPRLKDLAETEALEPGSKFIDPAGVTRIKPYTVKEESDLEAVPEGSQFLDPSGTLRQKPKFEPVDYTAQTLYDMSVTDSERKKALERSYPGKVKEGMGGLYVQDEDGTFRRPGKGASKVTGFLSSAAGPTVGAIGGALGGGALGSLVAPGPGSVAGGIAGAGAGSMAGQGFNDIILQLAGVYDRSPGEEVLNLAEAGAAGAAGEGVGRAISAAVPSIKAGMSKVQEAAPRLAANFLGANAADTTMARTLAEKGVAVPPSAWAKEAPHLQNVVEVFDPAFHTQAPLMQSATSHYEKTAGALLEDMGVKPEGSLTKPTADVATKPAGEAILQKTLGESAEADRAMKAALDQRKAELAAGLPESTAQREALTKAAEDSRRAAQGLIDEGFKHIQTGVETAFKVSKSGHNGGDLWAQVGEQLRSVKQGISQRASTMYDQADQLAGAHLPDTRGLSGTAEQFLDQLPGDFQQKYPDVVRKLRDLAGVKDEKTGEWIKEPVQPTFGQLHNMRSLMRGNADFYRLASDVKNGTYKFFAKTVDDIPHNGEAVPELKAAAQQLDRADQFYRENMPVFEAQQIKTIMRGLEAGEPADPQNLFNAVVKEGHSDLTARIRDMVGPNLWAGVKAADVQQMLNSSRTLTDEIDGRLFAKEVLDRFRSGMLETVHGKEASEQLKQQAIAIEALNGRLIMPVRPGDTMANVINRAKQAADAAKAAGKQDPLGTLNKEMKGIQRDQAQQTAKMRAERKNDPLGFLYNPTVGASEAVDKILGNEDLILAAAAKFGEKSPEFEMLRQVYAQRILQGTMNPTDRLAKIAPEIQQIMFPGTSLAQLQQLAKEMDFLTANKNFGKQNAQGMSAMAKVEHPWGAVTGLGKLAGPAKLIPFADPAMRSSLGAFYGLVRKIMTSPALLRWVEKGLNGSPEQRAAVQKILSQQAQRGGAAGAGIAESQEQQGVE